MHVVIDWVSAECKGKSNKAFHFWTQPTKVEVLNMNVRVEHIWGGAGWVFFWDTLQGTQLWDLQQSVIVEIKERLLP
jgi:hypothetical protein